MTQCATFKCVHEAMEDDYACPGCVLQIEEQRGGRGFYMHGREPSERYAQALGLVEAAALQKRHEKARTLESA